MATGYILSNVVVLPMTAFFTETFGRRVYLTGSIILFAIASFLCGISHSLVELVVWRVVQGAGGAALLSTAQATIRQIFPRREQGLVQAVFLLGPHRRADPGSDAGWMDHRQLHLELVLLHQRPLRHRLDVSREHVLRDPPGQARRQGDVDWIGIGLLIVGLACLQYVLEEGQRDDWFADTTIIRLSVISGFCLSTLLWWQLSRRNRHPVINLRVLKNRELAASIFLFVSLGFGLYGGTFIFPLFTESILGFTPTETGLALLPGGIATGITALICGRLLNGERPLADARVLIAIGVSIFLVAMWKLGHLTTDAGEGDVRVALMVRGAGLGLLFVPINNVAYASLEPRDAQQAAGLINLARQLGGSFGIAILATFVTVHTQYHRADLVTNVYAGNPIADQRVEALMTRMAANGLGPVAARQASLEILDRQVQRQASMLSYNDAWMLLLATFVAVSPAILLLRKPKGTRRMPADAH